MGIGRTVSGGPANVVQAYNGKGSKRQPMGKKVTLFSLSTPSYTIQINGQRCNGPSLVILGQRRKIHLVQCQVY